MSEGPSFTPFLGTNYVPSGGEARLLNEFIEKQQAAAEDISRKIEATKRAAAELELQHARCLKSIKSHKKLLSPIRRVPNEILSLIFTHCGEVELFRVPHHAHLLQSTAVIISHVSTHWRDLAIRTQPLWSTIRIVTPYVPHNLVPRRAYKIWARKMDTLTDRIQAWINRSSPYPMDLHLETRNVGYVLEGTEHEAPSCLKFALLLDAISLELPRIREIHCNLGFDPLSRCVNSLFDRRLESYLHLQKVVIENDLDEDMEGAHACMTNVTQSTVFASPSLRHLEIAGHWGNIGKARTESAFSLYAGVENLIFHADIYDDEECFHEKHALELLGSLPQLVGCELRVMAGYTPDPPTSAVRMDRLTTLTLHHDEFMINDFAEHLDLPSLRSLHLHPRLENPHWPENGVAFDEEGIFQLLLKFGKQLQTLTIQTRSHAMPFLAF